MDNLEIFIITWNRSSFLDSTLEQLSQSKFVTARITIVDNCSSDDTPTICNKWLPTFTNLTVIRHRKNIGGNANYLRAVELATAEYAWILCDDDDFDFSAEDELLRILAEGVHDIVCVGSPHILSWEFGLSSTVRNLIERGARFHRNLGFFPAIIFRTSLFDSDCLLKGYANVRNFYPQIGFVNKSVREDFRVYTCSRPLVLRNGENSSGFSGLHWFASWVNSCQAIPDPRLRNHVIDQVLEEEGGRVRMMFIYLCGERLMSIYNRRTYVRYLIEIFIGLGLLHRILFIIALPCALLPRPMLNLLRWMRWSMYGESPPPMDFDRRDLHTAE